MNLWQENQEGKGKEENRGRRKHVKPYYGGYTTINAVEMKILIQYEQLDGNIFENLDETGPVLEKNITHQKSIQEEIENPIFPLIIKQIKSVV